MYLNKYKIDLESQKWSQNSCILLSLEARTNSLKIPLVFGLPNIILKVIAVLNFSLFCFFSVSKFFVLHLSFPRGEKRVKKICQTFNFHKFQNSHNFFNIQARAILRPFLKKARDLNI